MDYGSVLVCPWLSSPVWGRLFRATLHQFVLFDIPVNKQALELLGAPVMLGFARCNNNRVPLTVFYAAMASGRRVCLSKPRTTETFERTLVFAVLILHLSKHDALLLAASVPTCCRNLSGPKAGMRFESKRTSRNPFLRQAVPARLRTLTRSHFSEHVLRTFRRFSRRWVRHPTSHGFLPSHRYPRRLQKVTSVLGRGITLNAGLWPRSVPARNTVFLTSSNKHEKRK